MDQQCHCEGAAGDCGNLKPRNTKTVYFLRRPPSCFRKKAGGRGNLLRNEQKKPSLSLWFFLEHFLWFVGYAILRIRIRTTVTRNVNSCSLFVILSVNLLSRTKSDEEYATKLISPPTKETSVDKMRYIAMQGTCQCHLVNFSNSPRNNRECANSYG